MNILVSACLLGESCRYDGRSKPCEAVLRLRGAHTLIPVCPEVDGGLPTPRIPSERQPDGRVLMRDGRDVSEYYRRGAEHALRVALENRCEVAILKERSPSCGHGEIHDGSFTGALVPGDGVTAELLLSHGIRVIGESFVDELFI